MHINTIKLQVQNLHNEGVVHDCWNGLTHTMVSQPGGPSGVIKYLLTHTYLHKPWKIKVTICNHQPTLCEA